MADKLKEKDFLSLNFYGLTETLHFANLYVFRMSEENTAIVMAQNLSIVFFEESRLVNQVLDFFRCSSTPPLKPTLMPPKVPFASFWILIY